MNKKSTLKTMLTSSLLCMLCNIAHGAELPVAESKPKDSNCGRSYLFGNITILGCYSGGNIMKIQKQGKDIGEKIKLGDMNIKGIRAFDEGKEILIMADIGDESGGNPAFYYLAGEKIISLGLIDIDAENPDFSWLKNAKYSKHNNVVEFAFDIKLGKLDKSGLKFISIPKPIIKIIDKKAKLFSNGKPLKSVTGIFNPRFAV